MAKQGKSVKQAAAELGVKPAWVRAKIESGVISPARVGSKRNGRFGLTDADLSTLRSILHAAETADPSTDALARIERLESDRANLLAQVAWARAIAQEQQKALELERERARALSAEVDAQRDRVERLKALSVLDRVLGRHKRV